MNTTIYTGARYHAITRTTTTAKDGTAKRKFGRYCLQLRTRSAGWVAVANIDAIPDDYTATEYNEDGAKVALVALMESVGLNVPATVRAAATEAAEKLARAELRKQAKEAATVDEGERAFLAKRAEGAKKSWEKLVERVEARKKAETATDATEAEAETASAPAA